MSFEIVGTELFLKAGVTHNFEAKSLFNITVQVDDTTGGGTPDATVTYSLGVINQPEGTAGNDAFVLTYSASSVAITVGATNLGTFPINTPLTLFGQGGTDSVKVVGTSGSDLIQVSSQESSG